MAISMIPNQREWADFMVAEAQITDVVDPGIVCLTGLISEKKNCLALSERKTWEVAETGEMWSSFSDTNF